MSRDWLVIDAGFMAWRSFFSTGRQEAIPSIVGTVADVRYTSTRLAIHNVIWCFDRGPYLRAKIYSDYKSKRNKIPLTDDEQSARDELRDQLTKLRTKYLPELGYSNVLSAKGHEADDLMALALTRIPRDIRDLLARGVGLPQTISEELWLPLEIVIRRLTEIRKKRTVRI